MYKLIKQQNLKLLIGISVLLATLFSTQVWAQMCTSETGDLPPVSCAYLALEHQRYEDMGLEINFDDLAHRDFEGISITGDADLDTIGNMQTETFDSIIEGILTINGGAPIQISASATVVTKVTVTDIQGSVTFLDTEMLSLDIDLGVIDGMGVMIGLTSSPLFPDANTGETTITELGPNLFIIDSFFDVFTEVLIDLDNDGNKDIIIQADAPSKVIAHPVPEPFTVLMLIISGICLVRVRFSRRFMLKTRELSEGLLALERAERPWHLPCAA